MQTATEQTDRLSRLATGADRPAHDALATLLLRTAQYRELVRLSGPPSRPCGKLAKLIRKRSLQPGDQVTLNGRTGKAASAAGHVNEDGVLSRLGYVCHVSEPLRLEQAAAEYRARQARTSHPSGTFDKAKRWYPDAVEDCPHPVRSPSRSFPYSYMVHCRTAAHVAWLYSVNRRDMMRIARTLP